MRPSASHPAPRADHRSTRPSTSPSTCTMLPRSANGAFLCPVVGDRDASDGMDVLKFVPTAVPRKAPPGAPTPHFVVAMTRDRSRTLRTTRRGATVTRSPWSTSLVRPRPAAIGGAHTPRDRDAVLASPAAYLGQQSGLPGPRMYMRRRRGRAARRRRWFPRRRGRRRQRPRGIRRCALGD